MPIKKDGAGSNLRNILLAIGLVMGFTFIVLLFILMIREQYGISCSCKISLTIIMAVLASLGVFVGILTYYFLSKSFSKQKEKLIGNIDKTLNFLDVEERTILSVLISNKGEITQNVLSNKAKIDSVKLHRRLNNLESKGIIHKKKSGMTNNIVLNQEFKDLFIN